MIIYAHNRSDDGKYKDRGSTIVRSLCLSHPIGIVAGADCEEWSKWFKGMRYTLSFAFLHNFKIPIEVGASFAILDALIFITAIDDRARLVEYVATEAVG